MFITVINDCKSFDEIGRQETRLAALFPHTHVSFFGVSSNLNTNATLEAAGGLIDVLDAAEDAEGVVLVNSAPRGDVKEDGHNGTPFCYFRYKNILVISTIKGHVLSLVKKLGLTAELRLFSVDDVMDYAIEADLLPQPTAERVKITQFRSFEFTPRVARWLYDGVDLPSSVMSIDEIPDAPNTIWYIDDFGNAKTTLLKEDLSAEIGSELKTNLGSFTLYHRLKDLPKHQPGMYFGSSGIEDRRFVELAVQQKSARDFYSLRVGQEIVIETP